MSSSESTSIIALVEDLIFGSKIAGTAAALNIPVRVLRTPAAIGAAAEGAATLLLDMNVEPTTTLDLIRRVKSARPDVTIVAFASHVQTDLIRRTREAGADRVLSRSKFSEELPEILRDAARRPSA